MNWICKAGEHRWTWTHLDGHAIRHCSRCAPSAGIRRVIDLQQYPLPVNPEIGETTGTDRTGAW